MSKKCNRRQLLKPLCAGAAFMASRTLWASNGRITPGMTEGPFYPDPLPLERDNNLLLVGEGETPAKGVPLEVTGRVLDTAGKPVANALVEIWQCDANGVYRHSGSYNAEQRDKAFQGYGGFETNSEGQYRFRTIRPVSYPGRTPHIHFAVSRAGRRVLTTQMFIAGHPQNARDFLLRRIPQNVRPLLLAELKPAGETTEQTVFDLYLDFTPMA